MVDYSSSESKPETLEMPGKILSQPNLIIMTTEHFIQPRVHESGKRYLELLAASRPLLLKMPSDRVSSHPLSYREAVVLFLMWSVSFGEQ